MSKLTDFVKGVEKFKTVAISEQTHTMDLSQANYFIGGTIKEDIALEFSNVPQNAKWTYSVKLGVATVPWDVSNANTTYNTFNIALESGLLGRIFTFKNDGTKLYLQAFSEEGESLILQYTLSTPWDISTASYDNISFTSTEYFDFIKFSSQGDKMYLFEGRDLYQYTLTSPWNISSAVSDNIIHTNFSNSFRDIDVAFKNDGTKLYYCGFFGIFQYTLSTPWDISTASYDNISFSAPGGRGPSGAIFFSEDGTIVIVRDPLRGEMFKYTLSTPWNISTVTNEESISSPLEGDVMVLSSEGSYLYMLNLSDMYIEQYELGIEPSITLPDSVTDFNLKTFEVEKVISYEFVTASSGSAVSLISQKFSEN